MNKVLPRIGKSMGRRVGLLLIGMLVACDGGRGDDLGTGPGDSPALLNPGDAAYRHLEKYLSVVHNPSNFDECFTLRPDLEPHLCLHGPRTGSLSGRAVHDWMAAELRATVGLEGIQQQTFAWSRFRPEDYGLWVDSPDGSVFEPGVYPWHFQGTTGAVDAQGILVDVGEGTASEQAEAGALDGRIVLMKSTEHLSADEEDAQNELDMAAAAGAIGAIVGLPGPENHLVAQNYDPTQGERALPTVVVGKGDWSRLSEMAGMVARMRVQGSVDFAQSYNEFAFIPGQDRSQMIVIGTPLNAWFQAASERGAGIGAFLYLAKYFAEQAVRHGPPPVTLAFVATGAHETLGFGLERALRCLGPDRIAAYFHLGTGMGSRGYTEENGVLEQTGRAAEQRFLVVSGNPVLRDVIEPAFAEVRSEQGIRMVNAGGYNPGEAKVPHALKIPVVGMSGGGFFHHSSADDATRVGTEYLGPVIEAFRRAIEAVLHSDLELLSQANLLADLSAGTAPGYGCPAPVAIP